MMGQGWNESGLSVVFLIAAVGFVALQVIKFMVWKIRKEHNRRKIR